MIRRIVFLFLFCFLSPPLLAASYGPYSLIAPIAVDGDTIKAGVEIWPGIKAEANIRVAGVDTPELVGNGARVIPPCEKAMATKARDFTQAWISTHQPLTIQRVQPFKFGIGAVVVGKDQSLLAGALIAAGIARPYSGGDRLPWCS